MAERLQARCDHRHVHQQHTSGRCKDAAHYPPPLIRAILRGIHDTIVAGVKLTEEYDELVKTLMALGDQQLRLPEVAGRLHIDYDCCKPKYVGKYTGNLLHDNLIHDAMLDALDDFDQHVWRSTPLSTCVLSLTTSLRVAVGPWLTRVWLTRANVPSRICALDC